MVFLPNPVYIYNLVPRYPTKSPRSVPMPTTFHSFPPSRSPLTAQYSERVETLRSSPYNLRGVLRFPHMFRFRVPVWVR